VFSADDWLRCGWRCTVAGHHHHCYCPHRTQSPTSVRIVHLIKVAWTIDEVEGLPFFLGVRSWEEACPVPSKSELFSSCVFFCAFLNICMNNRSTISPPQFTPWQYPGLEGLLLPQPALADLAGGHTCSGRRGPCPQGGVKAKHVWQLTPCREG